MELEHFLEPLKFLVVNRDDKRVLQQIFQLDGHEILFTQSLCWGITLKFPLPS